ncbi:MAG: alpha/beta hydrolase-fold protein [Ignavibacteriaceae bacterium]
MQQKRSKSIKKVTGKVRYHKNFYSKYLNNERDIIVWLPPSYKMKSQKKLPVLYMHDGQNIMDPDTSFAGVDWQVDETATKLIKENKIEEIIIVGIYNTPDRLQEYSDSETGNKYIQFIINELKPFIDSTYSTKPDKDNSAVMGSSMGGLISFLIAWKYTDVFSKAACLSSSFYYGDEKAIRLVKENSEEKKKFRIYIDHGEDGLPRGQKMFAALTEKGYVIGTDIDYYYAPYAEHNETAWAERLERPLMFLFGKNI